MKGYNINKGFSLIELIVVIAILAVFTIVLAPKLLFYTERSRAEKDNSSMDEVVNAIQLALADQRVYDEVLKFSTVDNISCYVDTNSEANYQKVTTKSNPDGIDQYTFTSNARLLDETPYFAAGNMRGVTITFAPNKDSNESTYDLKQGVVNQYVQVSGNQRVGAMPELYNILRSSVGDTITGDSQTYRNSEYTIFIRLGTIGGNDESAQDAVSVYGQWSGTNLPQQVSYQLVTDRITGDDGKQIVEIDDDKWNESNGSKITVNPGDLNGGGSFTPGTETGNKDYYTVDDFAEDEKNMYVYVINNDTLIFRNSPREDMSDVTKNYGKDNWQRPYERSWVGNTEITKVIIETPVLIRNGHCLFQGLGNLTEIQNQRNMCMDQCESMYRMFNGCSSLRKLDLNAMNVSNVTNMQETFNRCYALEELVIDDWDVKNVQNMQDLFFMCNNLSKLDLKKWDISSVSDVSGMFKDCKKMTDFGVSEWDVSKIKDFSSMFAGVKTKILDLRKWDVSGAINMSGMFSGMQCDELLFDEWNACNVENMSSMFNGTSIGSRTINLVKFNTENVKNMSCMFYGFSINNIDLCSFSTNNVQTFNGMFLNFRIDSKYLDVSSFNTANAVDLGGMFYNFDVKTLVGFDEFDISNVTNINSIFWNDWSLVSIGDIDKINSWDVSKVTNMGSAFWGCKFEKPSWYIE